ncbi:MAG TPA: TonB-dependent receptor plug domain-containing protein [Longimicrobiales bacterium]|nr:TonB-dependent receptor plug domain-containing protein [Longimicrobiales bacterium]
MSNTIPRGSFVRRALAMLLIPVAAAGCKTAPIGDATEPNEREGQILTREDIARTGAKNGWEALQRGATLLNIQLTREGSDARVTRRGVSSFYLSPQILLVVDGTHMLGVSTLEDIRASNIDYIQILSARTAVVKYGSAGGNGVIVVRTGVPPAKGDTLAPWKARGGAG